MICLDLLRLLSRDYLLWGLNLLTEIIAIQICPLETYFSIQKCKNFDNPSLSVTAFQKSSHQNNISDWDNPVGVIRNYKQIYNMTLFKKSLIQISWKILPNQITEGLSRKNVQKFKAFGTRSLEKIIHCDTKAQGHRT